MVYTGFGRKPNNRVTKNQFRGYLAVKHAKRILDSNTADLPKDFEGQMYKD